MYGVIPKIIWVLSVVVLAPLPTYAQSVPKNECATGVHAIIARGQGPGDDLNVMSTLSDLILAQIPGSTTLGLPYDHANVLWDDDKRHTVHDGAVLMQEFVEEYVQSCPNSKIVLAGYSMVRQCQAISQFLDSYCGYEHASC
jgi:acetylxylan esterase